MIWVGAWGDSVGTDVKETACSDWTAGWRADHPGGHTIGGGGKYDLGWGASAGTVFQETACGAWLQDGGLLALGDARLEREGEGQQESRRLLYGRLANDGAYECLTWEGEGADDFRDWCHGESGLAGGQGMGIGCCRCAAGNWTAGWPPAHPWGGQGGGGKYDLGWTAVRLGSGWSVCRLGDRMRRLTEGWWVTVITLGDARGGIGANGGQHTLSAP